MTGKALFLAVAAGVLAACSSATSGSGSVSGNQHTSATPDFPSVTPPGISTASAPPARTPSGTPSGTVHPAPAAPLRTATVHAPGGTRYVVKVWADVKNSTCWDHAYGRPVITFLTEHPCLGLERLLATTTVHGRPVGLAISETAIPGSATTPYRYAGDFHDLLEKDGTGSIADLLREGYRLPSGPTSVPAHEAFNVEGQDNGIDIYDAWYLDGTTPDNDPALLKMTEDIFLQV